MVLGAGLNIKTVHRLHAAHYPHRPAAVDQHRTLDYRELEDAISGATAAFRQSGVRRGSRVVLCMENRVEYLVAWFALFRIGAPAVHASYRATTAELDYLFDHSGAAAVVHSGRTREAVRASKACPTLRLDADEDFWDWLYSGGSDDSIDTDAEGNNVVYTSGTTGRPKGAVRDFASTGVVELSRIVERLPMREGDRHLIVCPLYHSGAQALALLQTSLGCSIYLEPHFDAEQTLAALNTHRIHSVFLVPTMIRRLLDLSYEKWAATPPTDLRCAVSGAAAFPHALRAEAVERFGASVVHDFYGATELGWITLIDGGEMMRREGSVGRPIAGQEVRIVGPDGRDQPVGEVGKLYVRNDQVMSGYLENPDATDKAMLPGGWMTVDDLARVDADGYVYLAGRDRDMVISGGVNLYPVEIEEVLARGPGVREVAVIGLPDDEWGERLAACVVWNEEPKRDELEAFARSELANFKVPREWFALDELPRNPTGKVLKRDLRERFRERPAT
jgi:fatty-acyl-CoA synthase